MRAWMRFISPDPEFSWAGTLFIVGASVIVGAVLGLARYRRHAGGVGWWRLSMTSLALLGAGGAVMWPSVVLGAAALGRPRPRIMKIVLGLAAVVAQIPILRNVIDENWRMSVMGAAIAVVWYTPMIVLEAWGFSVAFAPAAHGAPEPGNLKRVLIAAPLVVMAGFALVVLGLPGA